MIIYRHKENKQLYTIEHFMVDLKFTNNHAHTGIFAYPYNWQGPNIKLGTRKDDCKYIVEQQFDIVSEI